MPLNLSALHTFQAVAETGSVSRAADRLLVSQPAVSKQVKQLERSTQVKLVERHSKGVRLTAAGDVLAGYARRIFALAAEAEGAIADITAMRAGSLAIGASRMVGTYFLPRVFVYFRTRFPAISLRLVVENPQSLRRLLLDGDVDFALTQSDLAGPELESKVFMEDQIILVAPPRHPLTRRRNVSLKDLSGTPFVIREPGSTTQEIVDAALRERNINVDPIMTLSSVEALKQAVGAGLGLAFVSRMAAEQELASKRLVHVPVSGLKIRRPLYQVRRTSRHETKAAHAFSCLLKHAARGSLPVVRKGVRGT